MIFDSVYMWKVAFFTTLRNAIAAKLSIRYEMDQLSSKNISMLKREIAFQKGITIFLYNPDLEVKQPSKFHQLPQ